MSSTVLYSWMGSSKSIADDVPVHLRMAQNINCVIVTLAPLLQYVMVHLHVYKTVQVHTVLYSNFYPGLS